MASTIDTRGQPRRWPVDRPRRCGKTPERRESSVTRPGDRWFSGNCARQLFGAGLKFFEGKPGERNRTDPVLHTPDNLTCYLQPTNAQKLDQAVQAVHRQASAGTSAFLMGFSLSLPVRPLHRLPSCIAPRIIRPHAVPDWIETSRADYRAVNWGSLQCTRVTFTPPLR